ncbi:MAG: XRE family transcriptional regulator [Bdellovibrionales bacterium CG10_big_fil_rev_8_21_14_0_10_45_34]|nr:MAG: XRE family transcriptional regulator [Bdellovibrionales bacterium CG10_big_fil_rev_8_21_14_0_10_45_34]
MNTKKSSTRKFLEKLTGGPVTLGRLLESIRLGEESSQAQFAKRLHISRSHLNDIEKGNKAVSPERAARFARALGHSEERFVELALQSLVDEAGLKLKVMVDVA